MLERGPRTTLFLLTNAEGKPQMSANITTGERCEVEPGQYWISDSAAEILILKLNLFFF